VFNKLRWRDPEEKSLNALTNAQRKISAQRITGLPGQPQPDDDVGLFIASVAAAEPARLRSAAKQS
jgi:hypothetical protein